LLQELIVTGKRQKEKCINKQASKNQGRRNMYERNKAQANWQVLPEP